MEENYKNYNHSLVTLGLTTLESRRRKLTLDLARRSLSDNKLRDLFPIKNKSHTMETRGKEQFRVNHANTARYFNSAIPTMQRLLNED